jgi:hypothetical protein
MMGSLRQWLREITARNRRIIVMQKLRRSLVWFAMITLLLRIPAWGQAPEQPLRADEEIYRPTRIPDRVVLTWTGDPATSQAVTWRTDTRVKSGKAQIMPAPDGPDAAAKATDVNAVTTAFTNKLWTVHHHAVEFKGLTPNTLYAYRVGDGGNWSEWFHFRTASDKPEPFSFIYFGDVQGGVRTLWPRVLREAFKAAPDARFMAFAGDLVEDGNTERHWGEFFKAGDWLYAMIPMVPSVGNHDYRGPALDTFWRAQFTLPEHGPAGVEEYTYYIDYQGLRIISLNSMAKVPDQARWLEKVLADNPNKWTVLLFHYPMFANIKGRDSVHNRDQWKPVIDKYKVDLVFTGHDHTYSRTGLVESTVYIASVAGSKMYDIERQDWMRRAAEQTQFFQVIRVDGDALTYEARTASGTLYDAFELHKQPGRANRFVEKIPPGVPERLKQRAPAPAK